MRTLQFASELDHEADALIAEREARGIDHFDYELGDRYIMNPPPGVVHQEVAQALFLALRAVTDSRVLIECGFGHVVKRGFYVVPDLLVVPGDDEGTGARVATIAIEIRSPRESMAGKLADYREVLANVRGCVVDEVWYVDGHTVHVHPSAAEAEGPTRYADLLAAVRRAITP